MNAAFNADGHPRVLVDYPVEALLAIIIRHIGGGYLAPERRDIERYPALCINWLEDFRATFNNDKTYPIQTVFRANPFGNNGKSLEAVQAGEANWPLFAMWRSGNEWTPFTVTDDQNRITVNFVWVMPPHRDVEVNWALLTHMDFHLRRVIDGIKRCKEDRDLLKAAGISDICREGWKSEQSYKGPAQRVIYPSLTGAITFRYYWKRTEYQMGLDLPVFNAAYAEYFLRTKRSSGDFQDTRFLPALLTSWQPDPPPPAGDDRV